MRIRILVADDDPDIRLALCDRIEDKGHEVRSVGDGQAAIAALESSPSDLVFLDVEMPRMSGIEALRQIKRKWPDLPVIILTGHATIRMAVEAMKEGAVDFITKPFEAGQLDSVIATAMERSDLKSEITRLLGTISHDVKNLMMPLVTGTDILAGEIGDLFKKLPEMETVRSQESHKVCDEVIEMLRSTSGRIQKHMKEIADYVAAASVPHRFEPCRVAEIAENVRKSLRILVEQNQIELRLEGLEALPPITGDESRLYSALYNLVHNAIPEVPPQGSITISGCVDQAKEALVLTVQDTGRGMPPQIQDSLFTAHAGSKKSGGTGLGMKIVKDAVDAHHGQITVESREGSGTTFRIWLPLTRGVALT